MWPWEHLAFGYLLYSGYLRVVGGHRVDGDEATVLFVGTQFPDLVDKPLAWALGILPSGLSLAHSILFFIPVCVLLFVATDRRPASAFCVGYGSHLLGDAMYPLATGEGVDLSFLLWPLLTRTPSDTRGLAGNVIYYSDQFVAFLGTPRGRVYLLAELLLILLVIGLWATDGFPGPGALWERIRRPNSR